MIIKYLKIFFCFNRIQEMREVGLLQRLKYLQFVKKETDPENHTAKSFPLNAVSTNFIILLAGIVLSILILLLEIIVIKLYHKRKRRI
jgi:hypothetical protein